MVQQEIDAGGIRTIEIASSGDVTIDGQETETIRLHVDGGTEVGPAIEREEGLLRLRVESDVRLVVPRRLHVRLLEAGGDVGVARVEGGLEVQEYGGDFSAKETAGNLHLHEAPGDVVLHEIAGTVSLDELAGDLIAKSIAGDLTLAGAAGDVRADGVRGEVKATDDVAGDVLLEEIDGSVMVSGVAGDLRVSGCQAVIAGEVSGDVTLRDVRENVAVESVAGDATLDRCGGLVVLKSVNGDLVARRIEAGLLASQIGGSVRLRTAFSPGCEYAITCHGDATIVLADDPSQASVEFELRGRGGVSHGLPLQDVVQEPGVVRGRLGAGEARVRVECDGRIRLGGIGPKVEGLGEVIAESIESAIEGAFGAFEESGGERFERRMEEFSERFSRHAEDVARRVADKAERHAEEIARRAEEAAHRATERAERASHRRGWQWHIPTPPAPTQPPPPAPARRPGASEEERLAVLKMLSEGKITVEDATRLLEALGG